MKMTKEERTQIRLETPLMGMYCTCQCELGSQLALGLSAASPGAKINRTFDHIG